MTVVPGTRFGKGSSHGSTGSGKGNSHGTRSGKGSGNGSGEGEDYHDKDLKADQSGAITETPPVFDWTPDKPYTDSDLGGKGKGSSRGSGSGKGSSRGSGSGKGKDPSPTAGIGAAPVGKVPLDDDGGGGPAKTGVSTVTKVVGGVVITLVLVVGGVLGVRELTKGSSPSVPVVGADAPSAPIDPSGPAGPVDTAGSEASVAVPADFVVEATSASGAAVTFASSASSSGIESVATSCDPASGSIFPIGVTTVRCTTAGAPIMFDATVGDTVVPPIVTAEFVVEVADTTAPVVSVPADVMVDATSVSGAAVTFTASAADAVDGSSSAMCTPASGTTFGIGATTVTCTATDAAGNAGSAAFVVTVGAGAAPAVSVPDDIFVEAVSASGAVVEFTATGTGFGGESLPSTCAPASGTTFGIGATRVSCTATDAAGNTGMAEFEVTVRDTTAPLVSVPSGIEVGVFFPASSAEAAFTASATDAVDGSPSTVCDYPSGSMFGVGTTTVTCSATDTAGNGGSSQFVVTVTEGYAVDYRHFTDCAGYVDVLLFGPDPGFGLGATIVFNLSGSGPVTVETKNSNGYLAIGFPAVVDLPGQTVTLSSLTVNGVPYPVAWSPWLIPNETSNGVVCP